MNVYRKTTLVYSDVDLSWCKQWLLDNLADLKCVIPLAENNIKKMLDNNKSMYKSHFEKELMDCVRSLYRTPSKASKQYWLIRGYTEEEATEQVSKSQRKSSKRCVDHWISKGYTEEEAIDQVKLWQQENSKRGNKKRNIKYWLDSGLSEEEAHKQLESYLNNVYSFRKEFWINRGYTEEEASIRIRDVASSGSTLSYWKDKLGADLGEKKYNDIVKRKTRFGKDNHQFGQPAPKMSGRGISGYYKEYYFRSLWEYYAIKEFERKSLTFICNDVNIDKNSEKVVIPYYYGGSKRKYIPDFIIGDKIVEVKPPYNLSDEQNIIKFAAAQEFIRNNDKYNEFVIISDIVEDVELIRNDYKKDLIVIDKNKRERFFKKCQIVQ